MSSAAPLSRKVARQAVEWYLLEQSGQATPDDLAASAQWRALDPEHARAWNKVRQVSQTAGLLPPELAAPVLLALMTAPAAWLLVRHELLADYRSSTGQRRDITLPDGGTLVLNTDSAVDLAYGSEERVLTLRRGEVLVQTRPDHAGSRPFIVATCHGRIRALGTRFIVRVDDDASRVTVLEHAVEITPRAPSATVRVLAAGQQSRFDASHASLPTPAPLQADAWTHGMLAVQDMRLDAFALELARYRPGLLRVEPQVAHLRLSGAFQLDDTDAVLESLVRILPVDVLYRTAYWVTIAARKK